MYGLAVVITLPTSTTGKNCDKIRWGMSNMQLFRLQPCDCTRVGWAAWSPMAI